MMNKEVLDKYVEAGRICSEVKKRVLKIIKPGMKILDLAELIEKEIEKLGGKPAFPPNISINDIAAHYTPSFGDERIINTDDLVKIDIGVHIDSYIGDMAFTYCSKSNKLIRCAEEALKAGIDVIKPGVRLSEISKAIHDKIIESGFGVIVNLTGHTLDRYVFHGSPSIPNIETESRHIFKEGDVIALEPFVAEDNGYVKDSSPIEIYRYLQDKPVRLLEARKILDMAKNQFSSLPFAKRWLYKYFSHVKISLALKQLESVGAVETYPVLKEINGRKIAQAEHTIIVDKEPIITTL